MIKIEKPTNEDIKEIQQVFYETWLATYPNKDAGITSEDIKERFRNRLSQQAIQKITNEISDESGDKLFLVAKEDGIIVGVCKVIKKEAFNQLEAIYVLPNHQRKGIGRMLWNKAIEFFGDKNDIVVQVATYNTQAIDFYKKLGFIDYGKRFTVEKHRMPISGKFIPEMELVIRATK